MAATIAQQVYLVIKCKVHTADNSSRDSQVIGVYLNGALRMRPGSAAGGVRRMGARARLAFMPGLDSRRVPGLAIQRVGRWRAVGFQLGTRAWAG